VSGPVAFRVDAGGFNFPGMKYITKNVIVEIGISLLD
jgi:hypothetical protein